MIKKYIVEITDDLDPDAFEKFENVYDASEIILCEHCVHWQPPTIFSPPDYGECAWSDRLSKTDWYCSQGERKNNND